MYVFYCIILNRTYILIFLCKKEKKTILKQQLTSFGLFDNPTGRARFTLRHVRQLKDSMCLCILETEKFLL